MQIQSIGQRVSVKINKNNIDKGFSRPDISFCGNISNSDVASRLSKTETNLVFKAGAQTKNVKINGKNMNRKNILVTGASGYIGSHTAKYLLENGYDVVSIDNLAIGNPEVTKELKKIAKENGAKFKAYVADISQRDVIQKILKSNKIDAVVHFAAYSQVGESVKNPYKYYINNTAKTAILLDEMRKAEVNKIVFSSTAATYGEPDEIPIKETTPQKPINPYGKSKLMIENIMDDADKAYGLKSIRLRYFNVAGASSDTRLGEEHNPETHLIPNILYAAKAQQKGIEGNPFKLFGTDYPTPDGTCVRDYIHVEDLAKAHALALEKLLNGGQTSFYNLGSGSGYSVKEVFDTAEKVTGVKIPVIEEDRRAGDPPVLVASNEKAKKELGWAPEKTLEDMIQSAWNWIKKDAWHKH